MIAREQPVNLRYENDYEKREERREILSDHNARLS